jgi:long-chain acyl-CoA synthetase
MSVTAADPVRCFLDAWKDLTAPGAPFAMEEMAVLGRPARVFTSAPPDLRTVWDVTAGHVDRTYLVYENEHLTYGEVQAQVRTVAHHLATEHGIGRGSRVGISMRNYPEWIVTYWATVSLGAAVVGLNAWWTAREIDQAVREVAPTVLVVDGERLERLLPVLDDLRETLELAVIATRVEGDVPVGIEQWADVLAGETPDALPSVDIDPDDDATIFFTSGTTGFPKGAQITHRGSVHNIMHLIFWTMVTEAAKGGARAAADEVIEPTAGEPPALPDPTSLVYWLARRSST